MASLEREVRRLLGKAISHYDLIQDGDRLVVAVSGGKDSVLLLWLLRERLQRIPIRYELVAVHVDPGFDETSADQLEAFFLKEGFTYRICARTMAPAPTVRKTGKIHASSAPASDGPPSFARHALSTAAKSRWGTIRMI